MSKKNMPLALHFGSESARAIGGSADAAKWRHRVSNNTPTGGD
jgi:hypothetical protein